MDSALITSVIAGATGLATLVVGKLFGRRDTAYDQIQQDLKEFRKDNKTLRAEVAWLTASLHVVDDEARDMQALLVVAGIPVPPRKPWPARPPEAPETPVES